MKPKKLSLIPLTFLASLNHTLTMAETNPQSVDLKDVVVTAAGFEQATMLAPASVTVIDQDTLSKHSFRDLNDALRTVPGLVVTGGGSGDRGTDISIRGMSSSYTLLLVDGKRQASRESRPNGSAGFEADWLPPVEAIERIEVIRGPMSTLYGSDALGGVINVITKKVGDKWTGNLQLERTFQESDKSGDYERGSFNLSGPVIADTLGLQLYGEHYDRDEDTIVYGYEQKRLNSINAKLSLAAFEDHDFAVEFGRTEQDRKGNMGKSEPTEDCGRGGCSDSNNDHNKKHFALTHTGRWGIGISDSYIQREEIENESREITIKNTVGKTSLVMPFNNHTATIGASFEKEELEDLNSNRISDRTQIENKQWAMFVEDEWYLLDNFALTGGVRFDDNENFGSHLSPRLYGVLELSPAWVIKGGVSTGYRSPSLREITPDWGQTSRGGNVYGNPGLQPETSVNKEIGLYFTSADNHYASVTLFHTDFEDKITRVNCPVSICTDGPNRFGSDPTYRINVDEAITRGVEVTMGMALTERLNLDASYTYTDSEQKTGEYQGEPLTQLPRHLASISLDWEPTNRFGSWLRVIHRGEESQPNTGPSSSSIVAPSSTITDFGMSYKVNNNATVKAGLYNLFDEEIEYDEYGYVDDGRRLWVALNLGF